MPTDERWPSASAIFPSGQYPKQIELDIFNREDFIWLGAVFDSLGLLLCVVGAIMLLVPFLKAKFKAKASAYEPN